MTEFFQALAVLAVSAALVYPLMLKAEELGLVDVPNERKVHKGAVPVVGGIAIVLSVSIGLLVFGQAKELLWLGICTYLLLLSGMLDDKLNIRVAYRLLMQIMVALILFLSTGTELNSVGSLWPGTRTDLGLLSLPFTVFCVIGVINAINMIDGIDGLSGTLTLISFGALSLLASGGPEASMMTFIMAALFGFLLYNVRIGRDRALIFMGDAGSTVLGLWLAYMLIKGSQGEAATISPVAAAWFLGVPLLDATSVIIKRALLKRALFGADKGHLHHFMLDAGFSVNSSVAILACIQLLMCAVGTLVSVNTALEPLAFWGFVAVVGLTVVGTISQQRQCVVEGHASEAEVVS